MQNERVIVLDFGGQYNQLIARRVRECNVYCEVMSYKNSIEKIKEKNPVGIIFTGGPNSVYDEKSPHYDKTIFELGIPILGICYGSQLMAYTLGGHVDTAPVSEYGKTEITTSESKLFENVDKNTVVWMSHTDYIDKIPEGFKITAYSNDCPCAAYEDEEKKLYAVQYHPEVNHSVQGQQMLKNFLFNVCGCKGDWLMSDFAEKSIQALREKIGDGKVLCALSGGVDSSVAAVMLHKAVGKQLTCVFVDNGLLRKNEGDEVENLFRNQFDINLIRANAQDRFLGKLEGVKEPEKKRKIIGEEFIRVFEAEAKKIGKVDYLVQGTIYPDVIESGAGDAAVIKSHHNVGGLPEKMNLKLCEPLRLLFKDEVRRVGRELGMPEHLITRHPFPGPGLAVRILGDITPEKVSILQDADDIFIQGLRNWKVKDAGGNETTLYHQVWQAGVILLPVQSVGVMGDERTYERAVALRAVTSTDAMTADWAHLPYEFLGKVSNDIINKVKGVNRVTYDISSKPPSTIEWE